MAMFPFLVSVKMYGVADNMPTRNQYLDQFHREETIRANGLMKRLVGEREICGNGRETYVSTFRWPSLDIIETTLGGMRVAGWRVHLIETNVTDYIEMNSLRSIEADTVNVPVCQATLANFSICARSFSTRPEGGGKMVHKLYYEATGGTYWSPICPNTTWVIHFQQ